MRRVLVSGAGWNGAASTSDAMFCEHANETPRGFCSCERKCYCRRAGNTCSPGPSAVVVPRDAVVVPSSFVSFTVYGAPRTKKNSLRIMRGRGGIPFVAQSKQANAWEAHAALQLQAKSHGLPAWVRGPVNMRAVVYRERDTGDLGNYLAAVCDALQASGVIENDREIRGFDGSRLMKDVKNPRVEISLSPLDG